MDDVEEVDDDVEVEVLLVDGVDEVAVVDEVEVVAGDTVMPTVPELGPSDESPGYDAFIVAGPDVVPVTLTEQKLFDRPARVLVCERLQVGEEGIVIPPESTEKVTVSPL